MICVFCYQARQRCGIDMHKALLVMRVPQTASWEAACAPSIQRSKWVAVRCLCTRWVFCSEINLSRFQSDLRFMALDIWLKLSQPLALVLHHTIGGSTAREMPKELLRIHLQSEFLVRYVKAGYWFGVRGCSCSPWSLPQGDRRALQDGRQNWVGPSKAFRSIGYEEKFERAERAYSAINNILTIRTPCGGKARPSANAKR